MSIYPWLGLGVDYFSYFFLFYSSGRPLEILSIHPDNILLFKMGVGQNTALYALPVARNSACSISAILGHSTALFCPVCFEQ